MIYQGSPARYLPPLAAEIRSKIEANFRCLYLNSPPMVAGLRSYLFAEGIDVVREIGRGSLVLSSAQGCAADGTFDGDLMLRQLDQAVKQALSDGFVGLWATGDMSWECGQEKNFMKVLEYEWGLEELFQRQPALMGVCQYHVDVLPPDISRQALISHKAVFINETLSRLNPHYVPPDSFTSQSPTLPELKETLAGFYQDQTAGEV